jgi:dTDP-4-dehydrorhamnose 3,5-epimerase
MKVTPTAIPEVLLLEPKVFGDARGFFLESFNQLAFNTATGQSISFVQDNHSRSAKGVLRGLHFQLQQPQGKLVRVVRGAVFDVAVDVRRGSPTFGKWVGVELTEDNQRQLWVPPGFAHGFVVTSDSADFLYKTTSYYAPEHERCIAWDDADIGVNWQGVTQPSLSVKDKAGASFREVDLPNYADFASSADASQ